MNIRSPYNKPYSVSLKPGYEVRPMTRSYYYDAVSAVRFTGEEEYHTNFDCFLNSFGDAQKLLRNLKDKLNDVHLMAQRIEEVEKEIDYDEQI